MSALDKKYTTTAKRMNKAGGTAVAIDENLIGILKLIITTDLTLVMKLEPEVMVY